MPQGGTRAKTNGITNWCLCAASEKADPSAMRTMLYLSIYLSIYMYIYDINIGAGQVAGPRHDRHGVRRGHVARALHRLGRTATCLSKQHGGPACYLRPDDPLPAALTDWPAFL